MKKGLLFISMIVPMLYSCNKKSFLIKWKNYDGELLLKQTVLEGDTPIYKGSTPTRPKIKGTTYKFSNWDKEIQPAKKDQEYIATYTSINNYEIKWKNYDGQVLEIDEMVDEGDLPTYDGKTPRKENQGETYYYFSSWDHEIEKASKNTEYIAKFTSTTKYSDIDNDGLFDYDDPKPLSNEYNVKLRYNYVDEADYSIDTNFKLDYSMLDNSNNKEYSKDIAKLALVLDTEASIYGTIYFNDELNNKSSSTDYKNIYKRLGCDDIRCITLLGEKFGVDVNDSSSVTIAHHKSYKNKKDYIFVTFMMDEPLIDRWVSNMDVGYDSIDYYKKADGSDCESGEKHVHWTNKDYHKGFYVSANRIYNDVDVGIKKTILEMIEKHNISDLTILTSGHSRAGSIANIVASFLEDDKDINAKLFAYTFGPSGVYFGDKSKNQYQTIFNLCNGDDIVLRGTLDLLNSSLNGTTKYCCVNDLKKDFEKRTGKSYIYISKLEEALETFKSIMNVTRDTLYKTDYDNPLFEDTYLTESNAIKELNEFNNLIAGLNIEKSGHDNYFNFVRNERNLKCYGSASCLLKIIESVTAETGTISSSLQLLSLLKRFNPIINLVRSDFLNYGSMLISVPHLNVSYYVMIENNQFR